MADNQELQARPPQQKGVFERMSFFQKALLFMAVLTILLIVVGILLGGVDDFYQFFFYLTVLSAVIVGGYVIIKATGLLFQQRYYSPREDLRVKLLNMSTDYKPDNLNRLFFEGDVGKQRVFAGKIVGCLGLPYYTGAIKRYEKDVKDELEKLVHRKGEIVYSSAKDFENKKIPVYEDVKPKVDKKKNYLGDTLFVIKKGFFIFGKTHLIRCNRDLHSDLHGDVTIYDINPQPYGMFEYPFKQMQKDIDQIMIQNQIETIIATHDHQHDLISQSVDSAIYFNPVYRMGVKQGSEIPEQ